MRRCLRRESLSRFVGCLALTVAYLFEATGARAEGLEFGPTIAMPVPAGDIGDKELGIQAGVTATTMKNSAFGIGLDFGYHYWPVSGEYKSGFDQHLRGKTLGLVMITDSTFSLVTTPPEKLVPFQRVPHFDSVDQNAIALLHYLRESGGTSFYRHRSTGTEIVTAEVQDAYIRAVNSEVRTHGMPPAQYVDGDTPLFERIAKYDAVLNRVLLYRGSMLHSVNVPADFVPDTNPRTGRLTANTFLTLRPSSPQ